MFPCDLLRDLSRAPAICSSFWPGRWPFCQASHGSLGWPLTPSPATLGTGNPGSLTPSAPADPRHQAQTQTGGLPPEPTLPRLPWSAHQASVCAQRHGRPNAPTRMLCQQLRGRPRPTHPVADHSPGRGSATWRPRPHCDPGVSSGHLSAERGSCPGKRQPCSGPRQRLEGCAVGG